MDKKLIPTCNIMGVNLAAINMPWLIEFTKKNIKKLSGNYVCVSNVHTTVMSYDDKEYCAVQNGGIMAIPDGGPLSSVGRKRGFSEMKRTTGPDYMKEILKISTKEGYRHYFYGSTEDTLEKLKSLRIKSPAGVWLSVSDIADVSVEEGPRWRYIERSAADLYQPIHLQTHRRSYHLAQPA